MKKLLRRLETLKEIRKHAVERAKIPSLAPPEPLEKQ